MSVIKHKDQRVGVFIDIQNLYHSAKNLYQSRVNFKELLKEAVGSRQLIRAIAYVVKSEGVVAESSQGEASFFEALERAGIELRMKDLQVYSGGFKKADWDVGLCVDAIRMSEFLDAIVLVTGDGDFVPLVEYLRSHGRQVEVMAFGRSASSKLKEVVDLFTDLGEGSRFLIKIALRRISHRH
ncbi:MAG: hypothetical protein A2939_02340 [Parcubacteria group bacterium RIFCSPLOWO2_01_FULL_48_18]|nr:MAG: hypothetical protein A3J67_02445 [Parcubacteria group bacterium RIFCSPHIGHO2_02_FULL_48_10b]OHB23227.1 MAG: hypothetical protein A2939_02340 [Parcubacteria group bacterium RIFCSPLOWO2_01_FULL_48_18]